MLSARFLIRLYLQLGGSPVVKTYLVCGDYQPVFIQAQDAIRATAQELEEIPRLKGNSGFISRIYLSQNMGLGVQEGQKARVHQKGATRSQ
jgi:hypothetical protein